MKNIGFVLALLAVLCFSCDKKSEEPQYSGEIMLSSELLQSGQDYVFYGFSFETGKISTYSLATTPRADLTANHLILIEDITSIYLEGSDDQEAFYKNGIFSSATEAEVYFNNYSEILATDFQPLAQDIKENQVWTVQTGAKRFAKIWIKEITFMKGSLTNFVDIKIQYEYQPDGSRIFDCGCN